MLDPLHWLREPRAPRSSCCRSTPRAASTSTRSVPRVERDPERRAGHGDVGQQRGRHDPADRRGGRARARPRHPGAHRRRPGARPGAGRLRGVRRRRDDGHRAQGRRTRTASGALVVRRELEPTAAAARRGSGARHPLAARSTARRSPASPPPSSSRSSGQPEHAAAAGARCATTWCDGRPREVPDAHLNGDPGTGRTIGSPATRTSTFPGCEGDSLLMLLDARGIECSTGRRARPAYPGLARAARDGLATRRPRGSLRFSLGHTSTRPTSTRSSRRSAPVVERARAAASARVSG